MHDLWKPAGVIHLRVITDEIIYLFRIDDTGDIIDQLICKLLLDRINKGDLFINNQKCIVACTHFSRITVKVPDVPVIYAHMIDTS